MEKLRNKLILILTAVILIAGLLTQLVLTNVFSMALFKGFITIPGFFMIIGLGTIFFLAQDKKIEAKSRTNKYMLHRMVKMFLGFVFLFIYWLMNKPEVRLFAITFVVFYMIFLLFETYTYIQVEKTLKKNENQN